MIVMKNFKRAPGGVFWLLRVLLKPLLWCRYRISFNTETSKEIKENCLILMNHQASFDQLTMGLGFKFGINFVADDLFFHKGIKSLFMKIFARPISYSKGAPDYSAAKQIINVIEKGGAVGMFPEGTRSMYGKGGRIVSSAGKLAKRLKVPLVLVVQKGGYLTKPRWKEKSNKGRVSAEVVRVILPHELNKMSADEIQDVIEEKLYHNDFEYNEGKRIHFKSSNRAEHLESVLFYCPKCNAIDSLYSKKNDFFCVSCSMCVRVNEFCTFDEVENAKGIPTSLLEWSEKQFEYVKNIIDYSLYTVKPLFLDEDVVLTLVEKSKKTSNSSKGRIELYNNRLRVCEKVFFIKDIKAFSIDGVSRLNIFLDNAVYAVECKAKTNLVKHVIVSCHLKDCLKGCGQFAGIVNKNLI